MEPLVTVSDLHWKYIGSSRQALNGINFSLMPGETREIGIEVAPEDLCGRAGLEVTGFNL